MFDSDFLKKLEYLALVSQKPFVGESAADHRNAKMGGGIEFASYRDYVPGDDLRRLDWNVYARLGSTLVKRFQDAGDLHVYCCLDVSESMRGDESGAKFDYARNLLAALAYISLAHSDVVSVLPFSGGLNPFQPPMRGKAHFSTLLKFLDSLEPNGVETDFLNTFRDLTRKIKKPGIVLIVSDCFTTCRDEKTRQYSNLRRKNIQDGGESNLPYSPLSGGLTDALETLLYHRFEPVVIQVTTPAEESPVLRGDYRLIDRETKNARTVTINESALKNYKKRFRQWSESLRLECVKRQCRHFAFSTRTPFDEAVLTVARRREARG